MNHLKIEIPYRALRPLVKAGTVTYGQLLDYWFRIDRTHELSLPESFDEFTIDHLEALSHSIDIAEKDENWFLKLVRDLCKMQPKHVNALDGEHVLAIAGLLEYLKKPYTNAKSLTHKIGIFRGPANKLKNFTIEQLSYADSFAMAYHHDPNPEHLDLFFASAYRPVFLPWSKSLVSNKWIYSCVSIRRKRIAYTNYLGLRSHLVQQHPITFEGGTENSGMERFGWTGTILNLAGEKFGTFKNAKKVRVPDAFALFEMNGIQIKKAEEKSKKK